MCWCSECCVMMVVVMVVVTWVAVTTASPAPHNTALNYSHGFSASHRYVYARDSRLLGSLLASLPNSSKTHTYSSTRNHRSKRHESSNRHNNNSSNRHNSSSSSNNRHNNRSSNRHNHSSNRHNHSRTHNSNKTHSHPSSKHHHPRIQPSFKAVRERLQGESDALPERLRLSQSVLRKLLESKEGKALSHSEERKEEDESRDVREVDKWQCLREWLRAHHLNTSKKQQTTCDKHREEDVHTVPDKVAEECAPLLLLVIPTLCNGTHSCINVTEASLETFIHRYFVWERKKKQREEDNDAVIYIVVVLAFYSFGIVFMMANFVRQEQRELEETKMYKQYVKLARDRWLTTRGNLANKLALQALNTFNAVPQTTDVNKVTFV
nr:uncharacterized membrane protein DDB_G0293934-like [Cherax quadricarinatus]